MLSSLSYSPSPQKLDGSSKVVSQLNATHDLCQKVLARLERFELFVTRQLFQIQTTVDDLLLLSSGPFHNSQLPECNLMPHPTTHVHTSPSVESLHVEGFGLSSLTAAGAEPSTSTPCNSTVVHQTQPGQASEDFLPASHVLDIRHSSCSRENFASNTVKELFSKDERLRCNVKGVFGKSKFDIRKMEYVRRQTFKYFPITSTENEKNVGLIVSRQ